MPRPYFDYTGSVTFNLNVGPGTGIGTPPTGTVTVYSDGALLGSATLSGGAAALTIQQNPDSGLIVPPFSEGSNVITAQYSGDATYASSTSALKLTVLGEGILPDFSLQSNVSYETIFSSSTSDVFILHFHIHQQLRWPRTEHYTFRHGAGRSQLRLQHQPGNVL